MDQAIQWSWNELRNHIVWNGTNPYLSDTPLHQGGWKGLYQVMKMILLLPLALARLVLTLVLLLFQWLIALIVLAGKQDYSEPHEPWRKRWIVPMRYLHRAMLFVWGYYRISVKGKWDPKCRVLVANHTSMVDGSILLCYTECSAALKQEAFEIPFIRTMLYALQCVPVGRRTRESRSIAKRAIEQRILDTRFPPLLIFPEGTTHNSRVLTKFMTGAFAPGVPVQPVALRYPFVFFDQSFTRHNRLYLWRLWTQVYNLASVTFLPVCLPPSSVHEAFAEKVRLVLAQELHVDMTPHSYSDITLWTCGQLLADRILTSMGLSLEQAKECLCKAQRKAQREAHQYAAYAAHTHVLVSHLVNAATSLGTIQLDS